MTKLSLNSYLPLFLIAAITTAGSFGMSEMTETSKSESAIADKNRLEFGIYCSCGKGISGLKKEESSFLQVEKRVVERCKENSPEQTKGLDFQCSIALQKSHICFTNNVTGGSIDPMQLTAPAKELAKVAAEYAYNGMEKDFQVLGCAQGSLDSVPWLNIIETLGQKIRNRCDRIIEVLCKDASPEIHEVIACLMQNKIKIKTGNCLNALTSF